MARILSVFISLFFILFFPSIGQAQDADIIGNWHVTWADAENPRGWVVVSRHSNGELEIEGWQKGVYPQPSGIVLQSSPLQIEWNDGHLGRWGGVSSLSGAGGDKLSGSWKYRDKSGSETWTRSNPIVRTVEWQDLPVLWNSDHAVSRGPVKREAQPISIPVVATTTYSGPEIDIGANRPKLNINLYGDDMWGFHDIKASRDNGLEVDYYYSICKPAAGARHVTVGRFRMCMDQGGTAGVAISMTVWANARPGMNEIKFNGKSVPFILNIIDYPGGSAPQEETKEGPEISFVDGRNNRPINSAAFSKSFRVKAVYPEAQTESSRTVKLEFNNGTQDVIVRQKSDGVTYVSDLLSVTPVEPGGER